MIIIWDWISGVAVGLEFIAGGVVLELGIVRLMFLSPKSPYINQGEDEE